MTHAQEALPIGPLASLREEGKNLQARPPWSRVSMTCLIGFVLSSPFSISLSQIFVYTAIVACLVSLWREGRLGPVRFPLGKPFSLFAVLTFLSAVLSDDPTRSLVDSRQLFQILIFYSVIHTVADAREGLWLVKALLFAVAVASAYTLGVALLGPIDLANRMSGFYSTYMTLGGYLVIAGALAFSYTVMSGEMRGRIWVAIVGALIAVTLITTFSRNAWIGFGASAICAAAAARSMKGGVLVALLAALALILSPPPVRKRIWSIGDLKDPTTRERIFMWESGLRMVWDRPLFGTGLDMIKRTYSRYAHPKAMKKNTGHLHNNLLHIAAERGIPVLVAWVWIMVGFFREVVWSLRSFGKGPFEKRFLAVGGVAAVTGFLVAGLFEYNYGDSEVVMLAYLVMALPFIGRENEVLRKGAG